MLNPSTLTPVWALFLAGTLSWTNAAQAASYAPASAAELEYSPQEAQLILQPSEAYNQEGRFTPPDAPEIENGEPLAVITAANASALPPAPGPNFNWVAPYRLAGGAYVPGYWRPRLRAGFAWIEGTWDPVWGYLPGYWKPTEMKAGLVWVPGFWSGNCWIPGVWRPPTRPGFAWIPGHWTKEGTWIPAHWRPQGPGPNGKIWVPGYWTLRGLWFPGFWRLTTRPGSVWIQGHYNRQGGWLAGHWRSASIRPLPSPRPKPQPSPRPVPRGQHHRRR